MQYKTVTVFLNVFEVNYILNLLSHIELTMQLKCDKSRLDKSTGTKYMYFVSFLF